MKLKDLINLNTQDYSATALRELHAKMSATMPSMVSVGLRSVRRDEIRGGLLVKGWAFYVSFWCKSKKECAEIACFGRLHICADETMAADPYIEKILRHLKEP
ncbi:hypothetical protein [Campylobacter gracilis]|uniref:Uncharacterized protein n=1 Tax=Campylobacter gracilis RM3268 TaxID=553220 RepID=C8PIM3_9BACT|nr:hypothetical protein [Campylobacter gracilis]AKT92046.1 hypothetical protein CGRAC_0591 [Campylobacter gracilis]EEV17388.1 hypothetical protein CAMGR0001_1684 [Campylobacter gracilis RM3268]UEB45756.1 hypothetical protein LK410_01255 [Campylobacter gracilis]SUW81563.1 Uncharacterised protein [Campylobacter gracilis]